MSPDAVLAATRYVQAIRDPEARHDAASWLLWRLGELDQECSLKDAVKDRIEELLAE